MRQSWRALLVVVLAGCGPASSVPDGADAEDPADRGDDGTGPGEEDGAESDDAGPAEADGSSDAVLKILGIDADWGDIPVRFLLQPPDGGSRTLTLQYRGGCAGDSWVDALVGGPTADVAPGPGTIVWFSWDQEAGCSGPVRLRLATDRDEWVESDPFELDNTGDHSGFVLLPQEDQGVNEGEMDLWGRAVEALAADPNTDFIATRMGNLYHVYSTRGVLVFERRPTNLGWVYEELVVDGVNPLGNRDPEWAPTMDEETAAGRNPNGVDLSSLGYGRGDTRVSFVEPEDDSYPYAYERIAAYFDHPDSADLMVNPRGYARYDAAAGEHGSLNMIQSRSPLLFWGRGVRAGASDEHARQVDVAPTVAKLLGLPLTFGIDERGIWSHFVHLQWQDGHALEPILTGETAEHVILVVSDGLAHTELVEKLRTDAVSVPNLARLRREGAWMRFGSITNWPSVTYPSHNTIGAGVYSGHHGLVDNRYFLRGTGDTAAPISQTFHTEGYFHPLFGPAETLHMALHRAFGVWEPGGMDGAYTASLYDPSVKDADTADLEARDRTGAVPFPPLGIYWPAEIPGPDPLAGLTVAGEQLVEQLAMVELYHLYTDGICPLPRYVIMNFPTTDGAGHEVGPHGELLDRVLEHTDRQLGVLLGWLEDWDVLDRTVIVFTSDHGMQLGDPTRSGDPVEALDAAGIAHVPGTGMGVYLE